MAYGPSRERIASIAIEDEGAFYGTYPATSGNYGTDPTLVPSADGIWIIDSPNPFQMEHELREIRPHSDTLSRVPDFIGRRRWKIDFTFCFASSGGAASAAPREIDAFTMCGIYGGTRAATATQYMLRPAAISEQRSSTIGCEYDGKVHEANGCVGNLIMRAEAGGPIECAVSAYGLYQDPTNGTFTSVYGSAHSAGNFYAAPFLGVSGAIKSGTGSAYTMVFQSWELNMNSRIVMVPDANDTNNGGYKMMVLADRNPTLSLTIGLDTDNSSNLTYQKFYTDCRQRTLHEVTFNYTDTYGRTWNFVFPQAQVRNPKPIVNDALRSMTIDYKLTSTQDDGEFYIYQT